jgi:hypothetical protein
MTAIEITGIDAIIKALSGSLDDGMRPLLVGVAEETRGIIAPYPPQPAPANPRSYYVRGTGTVYVRRDGSTRTTRTSETLGRRWAVRPRGAAVVLENTASYAAYVHGAQDQTRRHKAAGWKDEETTARQVEASREVQTLADAYIRKVLGL